MRDRGLLPVIHLVSFCPFDFKSRSASRRRIMRSRRRPWAPRQAAVFRSGIADVRCAGRPVHEQPELQSTQASIAVSADGEHWFLINASPDLRQQLIATPQLHPKQGQLRHSPIAGVILTNGEIDAVAGLLSMREGSPFTLYGHERVLAILRSNSIFNVLNEKNVEEAADSGRRRVRA
jgi:phosphoribosyl 1,2-cyclic phosphodiesterase